MVFQPFNYIANRLAYFLSCLRICNPLRQIRISLGNFLSGLGRYRRYRSLTEEQKWWDESARIRAFFASSDARHGRVGGISAHGCLSPVPLITSYVPRLLPAYRDRSSRRVDDAASERELTPSVYQKWHRLVYPHEVRLSGLAQAVTDDADDCRIRPRAERPQRRSVTSVRVTARRSHASLVSSLTRQRHQMASPRRPYTMTFGRAGSNAKAQT